MASWYYVKDGERVGPVSREALDGRIAEGDVRADTLVWSVGMVSWVRAELVGELGVSPAVSVPAVSAEARPEAGETARAEPHDLSRLDEVTERRIRETLSEATARGEAVTVPSAAAAMATMEPAGFGPRIVAKLVDFFILFVAGGLVQRVVAAQYFDGVVPMMTEDWDRWVEFASIAGPINLVVTLAYLIFFIRRFDATPGKRLLGLKLLRANGERLGVGRIIGRHFAEQLSMIVVGVGYVMAFFDAERRTLHDFICSTRVVKDERRGR